MANNALIQYVVEMQSAGMADSEIISRLRDEGYSVKEISDTMNKAKVKIAIQANPPAGEAEQETGEELKPSITEQPIPVPAPSTARQPTAKAPAQGYQYAEPYPTYQQQPQYPYQYPAQEGQPQMQQAQPAKMETEYVQEIAEEIINEKWQEFKKKIGPIGDFKTDVEKRITEMEDRITRVEEMMDKMQVSILGKIQEYGRSIESVGTEVRAVEQNMNRLIDPLISNLKDLNKATSDSKKKK